MSGRFVGDDDDALVGAKTVHFHEQLVERLLPLVVSAAQARAALAADGVDLVDKDDAGGIFFRVFEQVADAGSAHADEHFHEIGTADAEERHAGFTGDRARQERFPRSRRADEQHALRNSRADRGEFARILEKFHHFDKLLLLLVGAGDVLERDAFFLFII